MKDKYFVHLIPIDESSQKILDKKQYKSNKSVVQMWKESL